MAITCTINAPLSHLFLSFFRGIPSPIPSKRTFSTLQTFESLFRYRLLKPIFSFFHYIHEWSKIQLASTIFIVLLRGLFYYNEENFLMNKKYHKNCFVRGSRREVFCKKCFQKKDNVIFTGKHLCRSLFFNKVNRAYFHFLVLQAVPSKAAVYK